MVVNWAHAWPTLLAAFLASLVEFLEALTVVLAVATVRGWRAALMGAGSALAVLLAIVIVFGPALTWIPLANIQLLVGSLLVLFGMRWLRKAILRAAGVIPIHDEDAAYKQETEALRRAGGLGGTWDKVAIATAFNITMLEGIEVVFIVVAFGAGGPGLLASASAGAVAALLAVIALGLVVHRPLASVPENALKFIVGTLLSAFGTFWAGEGMGLSWPGQDWSVVGLTLGYFALAILAVLLCRRQKQARPLTPVARQP